MNATTKSRWPEAKSSAALGKHPSAGVVIIEIAPTELVNGLYAASLWSENVQLGTAKFTITR